LFIYKLLKRCKHFCRFQILQVGNRVKCGEELEEAIKTHFPKSTKATVPFKESLNDVEQELTLLKEQLFYKQVLHQTLW
jgi:hypothetical protein